MIYVMDNRPKINFFTASHARVQLLDTRGVKERVVWASRPYGDNAWEGKPVAVMGASLGAAGTARAQYHLRQVFVFLNLWALTRPEVMIANAARRFDEHGNLVDESSRKHIRDLLESLVQWTQRLEKGSRA